MSRKLKTYHLLSLLEKKGINPLEFKKILKETLFETYALIEDASALEGTKEPPVIKEVTFFDTKFDLDNPLDLNNLFHRITTALGPKELYFMSGLFFGDDLGDFLDEESVYLGKRIKKGRIGDKNEIESTYVYSPFLWITDNDDKPILETIGENPYNMLPVDIYATMNDLFQSYKKYSNEISKKYPYYAPYIVLYTTKKTTVFDLSKPNVVDSMIQHLSDLSNWYKLDISQEQSINKIANELMAVRENVAEKLYNKIKEYQKIKQ